MKQEHKVIDIFFLPDISPYLCFLVLSVGLTDCIMDSKKKSAVSQLQILDNY